MWNKLNWNASSVYKHERTSWIRITWITLKTRHWDELKTLKSPSDSAFVHLEEWKSSWGAEELLEDLADPWCEGFLLPYGARELRVIRSRSLLTQVAEMVREPNLENAVCFLLAASHYLSKWKQFKPTSKRVVVENTPIDDTERPKILEKSKTCNYEREWKPDFRKASTTTTNSSTGERKLGPKMAQPASEKNWKSLRR